jgi:glycosyltransferase involved in cell wall biosynthesis
MDSAQSPTSATPPDISIIIPAKDEAENLPILIDEIAQALTGRQFEVIVIDDGSSDGTGDAMKALSQSMPWLRCIRHEQACGQSAAVRTGMLNAHGRLIGTIDGDGENDPAYLPQLIDALVEAGPQTGMAAGQRLKRKASTFKRIASKIANKVRGGLLKDGTRDSGCGLKIVRNEVFVLLPYFDSWHRFMAALVIREGFAIVHVDVVDRHRRHGQSKYGIWDRFWIGLLDLVGVWWLRRRRKQSPQVTEVTGGGR